MSTGRNHEGEGDTASMERCPHGRKWLRHSNSGKAFFVFGFTGGVYMDYTKGVLGCAIDGEFVDGATQDVADYAAIVGVEAGNQAFGKKGNFGRGERRFYIRCLGLDRFYIRE